jgi:hypothetical protein
MRDLDQMLDRAGADVQNAVRERTSPTPSKVHRRVRRLRVVSVTGWVLIAGLVIGGGSRFLGGGADLASPGEDGLITSEMILEDGVVTEDEYRAGALAVAACMADAGFDTEADFDDANGHASFFTPSSDDTTPGYDEHFERCLDAHLSENVSIGREAALGHVDLAELREETTAVTGCVEQRTGQNFGDLVFDEFGYLTPQGQQTRDAAFEYQDHEPWLRCQNDLGYLEDYKTDTRALLECVEERTGQDFGDLTFGETGYPDAESEETLRDAQDFQDHQVWETCREDLGIRTSQTVISDR